MEIEKISGLKVLPQQASFKGESRESAPVTHSDNNGAKFFAVAAGIAAVAAAGIAIKNGKGLKALTEEKTAVTNELNKIKGQIQKRAEFLNKEAEKNLRIGIQVENTENLKPNNRLMRATPVTAKEKAAQKAVYQRTKVGLEKAFKSERTYAHDEAVALHEKELKAAKAKKVKAAKAQAAQEAKEQAAKEARARAARHRAALSKANEAKSIDTRNYYNGKEGD